LEQNKTLVKLLAKENITIQHGNYNTAWFDIKNRTLGLPMWADNGKDVYDLLCGHEVGHALYTPFEGWHDSPEKLKGAPRSYINVVEDARIERKVRNEYPGLVGPFLRGYKKLADDEFFGDLEDLDFDNIKLIDKINLKAKLGSGIDVPFNSEEKAFFDRAMTNETFAEVVELCKEILAYTKENQPELLEPPKMPELPEDMPPFSDEQEDEQQPPQGHDDMEAQESEETESEEQSQGGAEEGEDDAKQESNGDDDSEEKGEEDTSSKSEVSANPEEIQSEEDVSITDEIFRDKECGLVQTSSDGTQTLHCNGTTKDIIDLCVIDHKRLAKERLEQQAKWKDEVVQFENTKDDFDQYLKTSRKNVNYAVKEFEMRKAAHQWQRATTAKSGSLDVNKVHSYKYNEDIFARVTSLADSKNHGMIMLIDYSGSMSYSMPGVLDQLMHLVQFCKAINIPFEVYAFTTGNTAFQDTYDKENDRMISNPNLKLFKDASLSMDNLSMPLLVSSDLKKAEFKVAMHNLYIKMNSTYYYDSEIIASKNEQYGSTPLNQALVVSHSLIKRFKAKHNIEKMNFVCLSDGDTNTMHVYHDRKLQDKKADIKGTYSGQMNIVLDGKLVSLEDRGKRATKNLLENIKKRYNTTNLGFFMADDNRHFHNRIYSAMSDQQKNDNDFIDFYSEEWDKVKKENQSEYRKNKCVVKENALGYDEFYVIKNGKTLNTDADNLLDDLQDDASKGVIGNAFKKMSKSKKTNKVLLTRFGKAVA